MEIDIRNGATKEVTVIRFAAVNFEDSSADVLVNTGAGVVAIAESEPYLRTKEQALVRTKQQALALIQAINKAIELGWWD